MTGGGGGWSGLSYGATERLLSDLQETSAGSIRTRFRKLRLRPFPDEIRSGTGVRISYDLPRVLALAAVFELSRVHIPQGQAVHMVEAAWPEWCRACVSAAVAAGATSVAQAMPHDASSLLGIAPDAFHDGRTGSIAIFNPAIEGVHRRLGTSPAIVLDAARTVRSVVLAAGAASTEALAGAFSSLELAFGWTPPELPHRASVVALSRGRGFLDEGPFFERAEALLRSPETAFDDRRPFARHRLEWLLSYVQDPAPIDRWKAEIGADEVGPRLKHLIGAWADRRGLTVSSPHPVTMLAAAGEAPEVLALDYIRDAKRALPVG